MRLVFGHYELDTAVFELRHDGRTKHVEPQVFDVLVYLARNADRVVTRRELLDALWPDRVISEATLDSRIRDARRAISDTDGRHRMIATVPRRGYRFAVRVECFPNAPIQAPCTISPAPATTAKSGPSGAAASLVGQQSLVVIVGPFAAAGDSSISAAHAIDWLRETLIVQLTQNPGVAIVSKGRVDACEICADLQPQPVPSCMTAYVIEALIWPSSRRMHANIRLTTAGRVIWAACVHCDGRRQSVTLLARRIADPIEHALNQAEFDRLVAGKPIHALCDKAPCRAVDARLGVLGWSDANLSTCIDLLKRRCTGGEAIARDHAYLALLLALHDALGYTDAGCRHQSRQDALTAAETALELNRRAPFVLSYAGYALAHFSMYGRGYRLLAEAAKLTPGHARTQAILGLALLEKRHAEGLAIIRRSLIWSIGNNQHVVWLAFLARGLLQLKGPAEAIASATRACRRDDAMLLPRLVLAMACLQLGQSARAAHALSDALRVYPALTTERVRFLFGHDEPALAQLEHLLLGLAARDTGADGG